MRNSRIQYHQDWSQKQENNVTAPVPGLIAMKAGDAQLWHFLIKPEQSVLYPCCLSPLLCQWKNITAMKNEHISGNSFQCTENTEVIYSQCCQKVWGPIIIKLLFLHSFQCKFCISCRKILLKFLQFCAISKKKICRDYSDKI